MPFIPTTTLTQAGGLELDYVQFTSDAVCSATTEAGATTIVTANAITFDGATAVLIEFFAVTHTISAASLNAFMVLYDGAASIGQMWQGKEATAQAAGSVYGAHRFTPSAASHTYSIRGYVSAAGDITVYAGAGGLGVRMPGYIRISRVSA